MTFGDSVKFIRKRRGMSQEQLAKEIGLQTKAAISKIEKGITDPNQSTIRKLANVLGVSPAAFFCDNKVSQIDKSILSENESFIIEQYRTNPNFKAGVDSLVTALGLKKASTEVSSEMA